MGVQISELSEASSVQNNDVLPIVQNGETKKVSKENLFFDTENEIEEIINSLKFQYDSSTQSYYATFGEIKIVIAEIEYTTGNTSPYYVVWNYTSPISFTKGLIYTTAVSGNVYRNIQIRPAGNDMTGNTTSGIVLSDVANYNNKFNILIIGY